MHLEWRRMWRWRALPIWGMIITLILVFVVLPMAEGTHWAQPLMWVMITIWLASFLVEVILLRTYDVRQREKREREGQA